ncbi:MAG TPA: hypothetical protein DEH78_08750, partial [Solibacterales bacterium]|nr:hypothetical protein [Bryobacterales bacterium]
TNILDMTPASLYEARFDGGAASERSPQLAPGSAWNDPHSGLSLLVGEATDAGITVSVRYQGRCAQPAEAELSFTADEQETALAMAAAEGCEWQALSGRTWLAAARNGAEVKLRVAAVNDNLHRAGLFSAGRYVVRVVQKGPPREMQVLSVSPPGPELPVRAPVPFLFYLRDENGSEDFQTVRLAVAPGDPASGVAPCYFRYSTARRLLQVSDDGESYRDGAAPARGTSGACTVTEASFLRPNRTDTVLRLVISLEGPSGQPVSFALQPEDAGGVLGPPVRAAEFTTSDQCRALPSIDFYLYFPAGASNQTVTVTAAPSPCAWSASTEDRWIQLGAVSSTDGGPLRFDVSPNTGEEAREGRIFVNGAPVRIFQYGVGENNPNLVTLRPPETVVSNLAGVGTIA